MNKMARPKITVYTTSFNYGGFLREAIDSVISQTFASWELILVDDGSHDQTRTIMEEYAKADARISIVHHGTSLGLRACANEVIEKSRGDYIIRLDADDYLDESALLVLSTYLDQHPDVGLVYPNWIYIDEDGAFLGIENRKKLGVEADVFDLPAHGACTMVRRRVLKAVGGYDTQFDSQDGHELWLKVLHRYAIANVRTPLFFYRQHSTSMSRDEGRLLSARHRIKRSLAQNGNGKIKPRIIAIVPAKNSYQNLPNIVLDLVADRPLIDYTLTAAAEANLFQHILVYTDDERVVDHCRMFPGVTSVLRPTELSAPRTKLADVLINAVDFLEEDLRLFADIVVLLNVHCPLRRAVHIQKAVDTLVLYNVDNVISTYEDRELHFVHGKQGMEPLNPGMVNTLRFEREALYVDNGAVHAFWREFIMRQNLYRGRIGHIVMTRDESLQIKTSLDRDLADFRLTVSRRNLTDHSAASKNCKTY